MTHIWYVSEVGFARIKLWWKFGQLLKVEILLEISQKEPKGSNFEKKNHFFTKPTLFYDLYDIQDLWVVLVWLKASGNESLVKLKFWTKL